MRTRVTGAGVAASAALLLLAASGCQTKAQTGALGGAGIGALMGQAIGHNTTATLIGTAVGAGVGYVVGNEMDKSEAKRQSEATAPSYNHGQIQPLGGTRWKLVSVVPKDRVPEHTSYIVEFGRDSHVTATLTRPDGSVEVKTERYRVVGSTLIVNMPDYLINARYSIDGNRLIVDAENFSAVLTRL